MLVFVNIRHGQYGRSWRWARSNGAIGRTGEAQARAEEGIELSEY